MKRTPRFHDTQMDSFFGDWFHEMTVDRDHPLVALKELLDWQKLTEQLIELYKAKARVRRRPYPTAPVLKVLFLSFLYGPSERDMERAISDAFAMNRFLGLGADQCAQP